MKKNGEDTSCSVTDWSVYPWLGMCEIGEARILGRVVTVRLARLSLLVVAVAAVVATTSGVVSLFWLPDVPVAEPDPCPEPPCFALDLEDAPVALMPFVAHLPLLGLALLIGVLSMVTVVVSALGGHGWRVLIAGGIAMGVPLLVLAGGEVVPHVLNPCTLPEAVGVDPPGFCARTEYGADVPDSVHLLYHALVGLLPVAFVLVWWARRRLRTGTR